MTQMTQAQAEYLAARCGHRNEYFAKCIRGKWVVWCGPSDHAVEFEQRDLDEAAAR